jgi:hypothetical protein
MSNFTLNLNSNLTSIEADLKKLFSKYSTLNTGFSANSIKNINNMVNTVNQGFTQAGQNFVQNMKLADKQSKGIITNILRGTASMTKGVEKAAKAARNIRAFEDVGMISGAFDGVGDALKNLGKGAKQFSNLLRASASQSTGMKKGILSMASKGTAALGPMLAMAGSIAGAFASVIAVMIDAEAQAKQMNKTLLEGGVSAVDLGASIGGVNKSLKIARDAAVDFHNNLSFGTTSEDQLRLITNFNNMGVSLKLLGKDAAESTDKIKAFQDLTKVSIVYSKIMGVSMDQVAEVQGEYMKDLGQSLKTVEQGFATVFQASMSAGFGTSRFFSMVTQATSGLAMYNVRTEQTAGLMVMLSKVLSPENAGKFLQSLTKGYGDLGYQERVKKILIAGNDTTKKIFEVEAKNMAEAFTKNLQSKGDIGKQFATEFGINLEDPSGMVDQFKKMSDQQKATAVAKSRLIDPTGGLAKEMSKMIELSKGTNGNMDDMAKGLDQLGPGGVLAMQMSQNIGGVLKPFHERSIEELMATESFAGYSGEQLLEMRRISETLYGNYDQAKEMSKSVMSLRKTDPGKAEEMNKKMAEAFGLAVDESGKLVQAAVTTDIETNKQIVTMGSEVSDMQSYIVTQGDAFENIATEETVDKQTALAMETAKNTTDIATIMKLGVEYFLEQIYGNLTGLGDIFIDLYNWFTKDSGSKLVGKEKRGTLKEDIDGSIKQLNDTMSERAKKIAEAERKVNTSSGQKRADAKKELEALTAAQTTDKGSVEALKKQATKLSGPLTQQVFDEISKAVNDNKTVAAVGADKAAAIQAAAGGAGSKEIADATIKAAANGQVVVGGVVANAQDNTNINKAQSKVDEKTDAISEIQKDQSQGWGMGAIDTLVDLGSGNVGGAAQRMGSAIEEANLTGGGAWVGKNMGGALGKEIGLEKEGLVLGEFAGAMTGGMLDLTADLGGLFYENREEEKKRLEEEAAIAQLEVNKKVNAKASLQAAFGDTTALDSLSYSEREVGGDIPQSVKDLQYTVETLFEGTKGAGGTLEKMGLSDASGNVLLGSGENISEDALMEQLKGQAFKHLESVGAFAGDPAEASARIQEAMPLLIQGYLDQLMAEKAGMAAIGGASDFSMQTAGGIDTVFGGTKEEKLGLAAVVGAQGQQDVTKALAMASPGGAEFEEVLNASAEVSDAKLIEAESLNFQKLMALDEELQKKGLPEEKQQKTDQAKEIAKEMQKESEIAKINDFFDAIKATGVDAESLRKRALKSGSLRGFETDITNKLTEVADTNLPGLMRSLNKISPATVSQVVSTANKGSAGARFQGFETPNDFIVAGNRYIEPSSKDTVIGFMPGGPVDQAMSNKKTAAGGGGIVNIHINGGNQQEVYNTVMKVLTTLGIA